MNAAHWQPIETAPKDGKPFITANFKDPWDEHGEYEVARYDPYYWTRYEEEADGLYRKVETLAYEFRSDNFARATHWMKLPEPPK